MASQKIRIKLSAYDHELVDQAAQRIVETMQKGGAKISGPIPLPTEREVVTILRCPHKYKDSREQFELRTYKRIIDIYSPSSSCAPTSASSTSIPPTPSCWIPSTSPPASTSR